MPVLAPCHAGCGPVVRMWRAHRQQHLLAIHQDEFMGQASLSTTSSGLYTASGLGNTARLASAALTHRTHPSLSTRLSLHRTSPGPACIGFGGGASGLLQAATSGPSQQPASTGCRLPTASFWQARPHTKRWLMRSDMGRSRSLESNIARGPPFCLFLFRVSSTRYSMMAADNTFPAPARPQNGVSPTRACFTSQHPKCRSIMNQLRFRN